MIRRILYKIINWLICPELKYQSLNDKRIMEWLGRQYGDAGFREWFARRDLELLKTIANNLSPEEYWRKTGQRAELLHLLHQVGIAHGIEEKRHQILLAQNEELKKNKERKIIKQKR